MPTTIQDLEDWFDEGKQQQATHMIVVCDSFEYEEYPVYVNGNEDIKEVERKYNMMSMQRVMEVYDLRKDKKAQLKEKRAFNY